jgi:hypothetical protein
MLATPEVPEMAEVVEVAVVVVTLRLAGLVVAAVPEDRLLRYLGTHT